MNSFSKKLLAVVLAAAAGLTPLGISAKEGWDNSAGFWKYYVQGGYLENGWKKIDGKWYCFDGNGRMVTGWYRCDGNWYWFNASGHMSWNCWSRINNSWYAFDSNGVMRTGWFLDGGKQYYLGSDGAMKTGWLQVDGSWYYLDGNGVMQVNKWLTGSNGSQSLYVDLNGRWTKTASVTGSVPLTQSSADHSGSYSISSHTWKQYSWNLIGFFQYLCDQGDEDALYALQILEDTTGRTQDGRNPTLKMTAHLSDSYDGMSIENVEKALDFIDLSNEVRARENLPLLKVNSSMMAIANKLLAYSNDAIAHSGAYNITENLAWGYNNPFVGWYDEEKVLYLQGERDREKIAHYTNLIDPELAVTGFAVSSHPRYRIGCQQSYSRDSTRSRKGYNTTGVSVAQYRARLQEFKNLR